MIIIDLIDKIRLQFIAMNGIRLAVCFLTLHFIFILACGYDNVPCLRSFLWLFCGQKFTILGGAQGKKLSATTPSIRSKKLKMTSRRC